MGKAKGNGEGGQNGRGQGKKGGGKKGRGERAGKYVRVYHPHHTGLTMHGLRAVIPDRLGIIDEDGEDGCYDAIGGHEAGEDAFDRRLDTADWHAGVCEGGLHDGVVLFISQEMISRGLEKGRGGVEDRGENGVPLGKTETAPTTREPQRASSAQTTRCYST